MILGIDGSSTQRRQNCNPTAVPSRHTLVDESFDEAEEFDIFDVSADEESSPNRSFDHNCSRSFKSNITLKMNVLRSTPLLGRRSKLNSLKSCSSTESSNSGLSGSSDLQSKTTYRILFLGASNTGKTSIVRQFLYDQFSPIQSNTMDDMYRGEFEDSQGKTINFDIQDVGGGFVYDFPAMKSVSVASADAFVLVFSLDNAQSWEEVYRLRDMIIEAKNDPEVPIVIVANKSDLEVDRSLPHESLEATAIFDWENGYVECSAKERKNVNKIFRELLNQTKSRFKISISSPFKTPNQSVSSSSSVVRHLPGLVAMQQKAAKAEENCLRRRQSLPAVPAALLMPGRPGSKERIDEDEEVFTTNSPGDNLKNTKIPNHRKKVERRSSLAALRRDSCKLS